MREEVGSVEGALVEPKRSSVAVHYRLVAEVERPRIKAVVDAALAEHPGELKVTPGKMVYEIQPNVDWDKGRAVLYLLEALDLDGDDVMPLYLGDDVTDEDAFEALAGRGIGIFVGQRRRPRAGRAQHGRRLRPGLAPGSGAVPGDARAVTGWTLAYDGFDPAEEGLRETLTSTGNGYFCTRGAAEWEDAGDVHYPGTYAHGVYNRETTIMGGRPVLNEDLVNLPNWLVLKLRIDGEEILRLENVEVLVLPARARRPQRAGHPRAALPGSSGPGDQAGQPALREHGPHAPGGDRLGADARELVGQGRGGVGARRAGPQPGRRPLPAAGGPSPRSAGPADLRPRRDRAEGADPALADRGGRGRAHPRLPRRRRSWRSLAAPYQTEDYVQQVLAFDVQEGEPVRVEKMVGPLHLARPRHQRAAGQRDQERRALSRRSTRPSPATRGRGTSCGRSATSASPATSASQFLLRLHISHVLQVCSRLTAHHDAGVPPAASTARPTAGTSSGTSSTSIPSSTSGCPRSRAGCSCTATGGSARPARRRARPGYRGAMYPWQSGSDGEEETQRVHLNPLSGRWEPDLSRNQRHVNAAIFYNIWRYYQATARHRLPARLRRRDDARDRALLVVDRALQPRPRSVGDPRGHGPRRVPREVPGRDRGRPAQQRLHERHGGLDLRDGADGARPPSREPPRCAAGEGRPRRRGARAGGTR